MKRIWSLGVLVSPFLISLVAYLWFSANATSQEAPPQAPDADTSAQRVPENNLPELLPEDAVFLRQKFPDFVTPIDVDRMTLGLVDAIDANDVPRVATLLEEGARAASNNMREREKFFPLFRAIKQGNLEIVQLLLKHGAASGRMNRDQFLKSRNQWSQTPLYYAVRFGNRKIVETLLENGANPSAPSGYGKTPLVAAVEEGNLELFELLLMKNAKFELGAFGKDRKPRPPGAWLHEYPADYFARPFEDNCDGVHSSLLQLAKLSGNKELMAKVAKQVNESTRSNQLRAEAAVREDNALALQQLMDNGYDVTTYKPDGGKHGSTLLDQADFMHSPRTFDLLSKAGAPMNRDSSKTTIQVAVEAGELELLNELLRAGVKLESLPRTAGRPGRSGPISPLLLAVRAKQLGMVQFLLKRPEATEWLQDGELLLAAAPYIRSHDDWDPTICMALLNANTKIDLPDVSNANLDYHAVLRIAAAGWLDAYKLVMKSVGSELNHHDAIQAAAFGNQTELCEFLLSKGASASASRLRFCKTPIESALFRRNVKLIEMLTEAGASKAYPKQFDVSVGYNSLQDYAHPIYHAALAGDTEFCRELIKRYPASELSQALKYEPYEYDSDIAYFNRGNTPLFAAVFGNHDETLRVLLSFVKMKDATGKPLIDINAMNSHGHTALHEAINYRAAKCVQLLLAAGADPTTRITKNGSVAGDSAFHMTTHRPWAAHSYARHNVEPEYVLPLLSAAAHRLKKRDWVNIKNAEGMTPLHRHAAVADERTCRNLLDFGADVNAKTKHGQTALLETILGVRSGYTTPERARQRTNVAKMLVESGATLDAKAWGYEETSHYALAFQKGMFEFCDYLEATGEEPKVVANGGEYLCAATKYKRLDLIEKLISQGADINAQDANRETALYLAVSAKDMQICRKLIELGADPNAKGRQGITPLFAVFSRFLNHMGYFNGSDREQAEVDAFAVFQLLLESGADPHAKTDKGATVLSMYSAMPAKFRQLIEKKERQP